MKNIKNIKNIILLISFISLLISSLSIVYALDFGIGSKELPNLIPAEQTTSTSTTNYSLVNVNNSQYLQSLTPQQVANLYVETDTIFISNNGSIWNAINSFASGTLTNPIQNNGVVYINGSGSQVTNNQTLFLLEGYASQTISANATILGNDGAVFQNLQIIGTNSGGCSYTYNTAPYSKTVICNASKFTKEARVNDYIGLSTCTSNYDEIATIVNDTQLTTTSNLLGNACGNNYVSATAMPLIVHSTTLKATDGTPILKAYTTRLSSAISKGLDIYYSITLPNSYQYGCNGNCYFNAISGSGIAYSNGYEVFRWTRTGTARTGGVIIALNQMLFGSDGVGGAGGGLKTTGVVRGSDNGGSTDGGSTPLSLQSGLSRGANALTYVDFWVSQPTTSGTTLQVEKRMGAFFYNRLALNTTLNMTGFNGERNGIVGANNIQAFGNISSERVDAPTINSTNIYGVNGNFTGNVNIVGNITTNEYYGEMYSKNDTGVGMIDLATADVYVMLANQTNGTMNGFSLMGGSNLTADVSGVYQVNAKVAVTAGSPAGEYGMKVYVTDTEQNNCYDHFHVGADQVSMIISCIVRMNVGDNINVRFDDNASPVTDLTFYNSNINLRRIGN